MDVFDGMRWLLDKGVDLEDRAAVERSLWCGMMEDDPAFVDWCIKAAKANKAAGGLQRNAHGITSVAGFVPPER